MEQVRPRPAAGQAGGQAVREAAASPARLQERAELLEKGEAALARREVTVALDAFERAALILHAADTEIALVRATMQAGDYRRALAFGAHTAGAHLDVVGGSLLYAWLLQVGGQPAIAQRLLAGAEVRMPGNPMLQAVQQQLRSGAPAATGQLLALPTRLAPYGGAKGLPEHARVVGTAMLLHGGRAALAPLGLLPRSGWLWLRNGLGQLVRATTDKRLSAAGVALLRLQSPLPVADELPVAASDAFPGSAAFAVEYVTSLDAAPAWPVLRTGFLGSATGDSGERLLGIEMPAGPRGGPVFDGAGRLIGLALPGAAGQGDDRLVPASQLVKMLNRTLAAGQLTAQNPSATAPSRPRGSVDTVYEASLKTSLQVITAP
ncbi:MAG: hypothetical protein JWP96_856 [Polaromonas sp.]|nr:hypothetical protein [Polaromonas sp.]